MKLEKKHSTRITIQTDKCLCLQILYTRISIHIIIEVIKLLLYYMWDT